MKAIDLAKLEHEILPDQMPSFLRKEMHPAGVGAGDDINRYAPPLRPLPDYVEHKPGVPRVGALSAQAVVEEYERAAKEIEAMGQEMIETGRRCDELQARIAAALERISATAQNYRDEAKRVFIEIEGYTILADDVCATCDTLRRRIQGGPAEDTPDAPSLDGSATA